LLALIAYLVWERINGCNNNILTLIQHGGYNDAVGCSITISEGKYINEANTENVELQKGNV